MYNITIQHSKLIGFIAIMQSFPTVYYKIYDCELIDQYDIKFNFDFTHSDDVDSIKQSLHNRLQVIK